MVKLQLACEIRQTFSSKMPDFHLLFYFTLLSMCNRNTYFQAINQYFVVSEWKKQVVIEPVDTISQSSHSCEVNLS